MVQAIPAILSAIQMIQKRNLSEEEQKKALSNMAELQLPQNQIPTITSVYSNLWR